ncbi:MAG: CRISPR system precrRNA processing endoribonuclease RAMP protein Cas6 [Candidatus Dadabacteria bacterium]|nr:MAG: CRISPR system precrRNA processing endoribonuclease RAMP protein Cas6 [Candidatus Dadabacteria bacterium]
MFNQSVASDFEPARSSPAQLNWKKYTFRARLDEDASLPPYKGSTFRGVFGHALKHVVCALKTQDCPTCLLRKRCLYPRVFEDQSGVQLGSSRRASAPHPYIIEPPLDDKTDYRQGECFEFDLILLGDINGSLPYFIYAIIEMGKRGIGKGADGKRAQFTLLEVRTAGTVIFTLNSDEVKIPDSTNLFTLNRPNSDKRGCRILVRLETPLRLKSNGQLQDSLDFELFQRAMLRRAAAVLSCYGDVVDLGRLTELLSWFKADSADVAVSHSDLRWHDWERYSARQGRRMRMGGLIGEIEFSGPLTAALPLFRFSELFHLGKQSSFGLGKISCELLEE